MNFKTRLTSLLLVRAVLLIGPAWGIAGCRSNDTASQHATEHADSEQVISNRIAIPASVRQNLGITFVNVERRPVRSTVRLPGTFELRPVARRDYHVMLPGRIELLVSQYEHIKAGQPLFHVDSPEWRRIQNDLVAALNNMKRSHADVAVAEANLNELKQSIAFLEQRIQNLASAQVRQVELESQLADKHNTLPRLKAQLDAARVEFDAAHSRYEVMLGTASSLSGIAIEQLDPEEGEEHEHVAEREPPWRSVTRITVNAEADGVVDRMPITNRGWAETGELVLDTVNPTMLRFHADAMQTDINMFSDGQSARIVPPSGGSFRLQDTADGRISVGFEAHAGQRTVPIYMVAESFPAWAKAGVTAYLEVFIDPKAEPVNAIPESAIVRDGLRKVFFRRNPSDPDEVIRVDADLGTSDGRWTEVRSGVKAGDEIVLGGVYPLMLASSSSGEREAGGHFHPDGTFHSGKDK